MGTIPAGVQPGDFFCVYTGSEVSRLVALGEWLNGDKFSRTPGKRFSHSGVAVAVDDNKALVQPRVIIVEAQPGGVRRVPWHYDQGCVVIWSTGRVVIPDRGAVVAKAESLVGTPYGFLNYPAMGARRLHLPVPLLDRYVASEHSLICSELTDISERAGGYVLCPDRPPGRVTPQEIADTLLESGARKLRGRASR